MSQAITLARPYAQAAFDLASERNELSVWSQALSLLTQIVADERVAKRLHDPRVSREILTGLILDVASTGLTKEAGNFVRVLVENRRLDLLPAITQQFELLRAQAEGTLEVQAVTAIELNANQIKALTEALKKKFGRQVQLQTAIDPALLGGVLLRAGDLVIDGSVRGRLHELSSQLNR